MATLVALLALLLQGFLVQTHVHVFSLAASYEQSAGATHSDSAHLDAAHQQASCVICQALANSGRAALPQAPKFVAHLSGTYETAVRAIRNAPRSLTHSWQSRAPPIAL
jgi:Protein of unknown function (DUF2946)